MEEVKARMGKATAKRLVAAGDLLRSRHVAIILDICPDDAITLARRGMFSAFKVGRYWYYPRKAVEKYAKKVSVTA